MPRWIRPAAKKGFFNQGKMEKRNARIFKINERRHEKSPIEESLNQESPNKESPNEKSPIEESFDKESPQH